MCIFFWVSALFLPECYKCRYFIHIFINSNAEKYFWQNAIFLVQMSKNSANFANKMR